jgi:hypothetical protein
LLSLQWSGAHVAWDQLSNLTIDLQGSDLYFSHPFVNGILITRSTNIVLQNFTADYDPLPFTQVRVVYVDAVQRKIRFAVDGAWQNPSVLNAVFGVVPSGVGGVKVHIFRNGRPAPDVAGLDAANPIGSSQFTLIPPPPGFPTDLNKIRPGDIAFMGMRTAAAGPVTVSHCTGCTLRHITAYSSVEWGVEADNIQNTVFEHVYSMPRPGHRPVSQHVGARSRARGPGQPGSAESHDSDDG